MKLNIFIIIKFFQHIKNIFNIMYHFKLLNENFVFISFLFFLRNDIKYSKQRFINKLSFLFLQNINERLNNVTFDKLKMINIISITNALTNEPFSNKIEVLISVKSSYKYYTFHNFEMIVKKGIRLIT